MATDIELLERWSAGDRRAADRLVRRHFDSLQRFFARKVERDVDELVQATFFALVRAKHQFRSESSFRTYLFTIAKHELYRHLRQQARVQTDFTQTSLADLQTTPTARIAKDRNRQRLLEALRLLPVEEQLMLELHYWEGVPIKELAEVFELKASTARTRLLRARSALRERIEKLGGADLEMGSSSPTLDEG